ncbi:nitrate- and nitrite sensing domain-containing protein [Microbispora sp. NBC_01189]|uniref:sensor histidine kinase n=1 Tax=Microbispora sp. NBC_01189 TaxID=2903583 RepID=UPI002E0F208E|nr:nitrate- and nitrite sensing domain-containing protein [Microbispora sp. NBC_01189]
MRTATVESGRRSERKPPPLPAGSEASAGELGEQPAQPEPPGQGAGSRLALKNWRMRTRLLALILVPTAVAVTLGGLRVSSSISSAAEYRRVQDVAELVLGIGDFVHELQLERDLTARYVGTDRRGGATLSLIHDQQSAVDAAAQRVRSKAETAGAAFGDIGRADLVRLRGRLDELPALRTTILESKLPALPAIEKYSQVAADALRLYDETVQGAVDEGVIAGLKSMASLARTEEEVSKQRALLAAALVRNRFENAEIDAFTAARAREVSERNAFLAQATAAQRQLFSDTVTGQKVDRAEYLRALALSLTRDGLPLHRVEPGGQAADTWFDAITETGDQMHKVNLALAHAVITRSEEFQASDQRVAAINVALVVAVLLVVLVITLVMARSVVRPLRRLRSEALEVAGHRLPGLVQRLRESDSAGSQQVQPIGVLSADEIGEVARAFDEVHREAVRLAGDEARLRGNVNAMFVNLSRRTQTLVERQITLIDGLEQGEQDEERLANLFKLDHLATRMRRNSENLLVLAGQETARRWSRPVEITDVLRASLSEVEGYERVVLNFPSDVSIAGQAVNDIIHLMAELVENALSFSARDTRVVVSGNRIDGGGVMISVTDSGIGMTAEEISQANWRLANPPVVDVSVSRRMGLFVVGRLGMRHGIRVQLRPHDGGGLTAMVLLPESLMGGASYPEQAYAGAFAPAWSGQPGQSSGWNGRPQGLPAPAAQPALPAARQPGMFSRTRPFDPLPGEATGPIPAVSGPAFPDPAFSGSPFSGSAFSDPTISGPIGAQSGAFSVNTGPVPMPSGPGAAQTGPTQFGPAQTGPVYGAPVGTGGAPPAPPAEEFLPIFASVESAWFRRTPATDTGPADWQREQATDAGWQAAAAAAEKPAWEGTTTSGLPKRVPKANLVPGSADSTGPQQPQAAQTQHTPQTQQTPRPPLSPDRARSRLSSFQQGVRQGRAVARGELSEDEGYPTKKGDGA